MKLKLYLVSITVVSGIILGFIYYNVPKINSNKISFHNNETQIKLKIFTTEELAKFNGVNPKLPIYLALDGNVYDISKGKEFYQLGGPYHNLAGKDSSVELHLVGGEIIKRKYPVIGKLLVKTK